MRVKMMIMKVLAFYMELLNTTGKKEWEAKRKNADENTFERMAKRNKEKKTSEWKTKSEKCSLMMINQSHSR